MFIRPRLRLEADAPSVIYLPGGGGTETSWQAFGTTENPNVASRLVRALADSGCRLISIPTGWEWGNQTTLDRISDEWAYAQANYGFPADHVHLVTVSAGAFGALNWARENPEYVASLSHVVPPLDLEDVEANPNLAAWSIPAPSTAYGGSIPSEFNPIENTTDYTNLEGRMWYSNNDAVCDPDIVRAFASQSGFEAINLGDRFPVGFAIPGHDAGNLPVADVVDFVHRNEQ